MDDENRDEGSLEPSGMKKGLTLLWTAILITAFILLGGTLFISSTKNVRIMTKDKTIQNNLRQIAVAADYFHREQGNRVARLTDLIGTDKFINSIPKSAAGEDYETLFPIYAGFTELSISKDDGEIIRYKY